MGTQNCISQHPQGCAERASRGSGKAGSRRRDMGNGLRCRGRPDNAAVVTERTLMEGSNRCIRLIFICIHTLSGSAGLSRDFEQLSGLSSPLPFFLHFCHRSLPSAPSGPLSSCCCSRRVSFGLRAFRLCLGGVDAFGGYSELLLEGALLDCILLFRKIVFEFIKCVNGHLPPI